MQDDASHLHNLDPRLRRALIHPSRREILGHLMRKPDGSATTERELAEAFGMAIPLVEYHLKVLQDAGLIAHVDDVPKGEEPAGRSYVAAAT